MSETTPNSKGPAPVQYTPEAAEPALGTLSIEYRDGRPVIVVSGGTAIPERISVVDASGNPDVRFQAVAITGVGPVAFNQYAFSANDPINFIDVNGN
ncbi:hypothetical protein ACFWJ4_26555 [Kitasatospora sp. NPDC127067]|uniref:hypothetical protein n=1 Tax=Kitasatospora sp. NPDC127067 TaxID=3347126 RepID=UPI00364D7B6F